jgi:amidase
MDDALGALKAAGATLVDPVEVPNLDKLGDPEFDVLLTEFKAGLNAYLAAWRGGAGQTLADVIRLTKQCNARCQIQPGFRRQARRCTARAECTRAAPRGSRDGSGATAPAGRPRGPTGGPAWTDRQRHHLAAAAPLCASRATGDDGPGGQCRLSGSFMGPAWSEAVLIKFAHSSGDDGAATDGGSGDRVVALNWRR